MRLAPLSARAAVLTAAVAASALALSAAAGSARLVGVSAETRAGAQTVLIESTEPVAYSVSRPDARNLLVELRNVSVAGAANRIRATDGSLVADVAFENGTALDGSTVGRVHVALTRPASHRVRSTRNTIRIELEKMTPAEAAEAEKESAAGTVIITAGVDRVETVAVPDPDAAPDAPTVVKATSLTAVRTSVTGARTVVTLAGNGFLSPSNVSEAEAAPPRLVIDFPGVTPAVPASTDKPGGPVERVRVAVNSRTPLVTRVVVDLSRKVAYHVERTGAGGHELALVFEEGQPAGPVLVAPVPAEEKTPNLATAAGAPAIDPMSALSTPPAASSGKGAAPPKAATTPATSPASATSAKVDGQTPPAPQPPTQPAGQSAQATSQPAPTQSQGSGRPTADVSEGRKRYSGHPVSLDFQNADLRSVLRTFAEISGLNMVIDPSVQGTVDIVLTDVPWDQALDIILRGNQLGFTVDGTIVRIAPLKILAAEEEERRKLHDAQALAGELRVRTFALSYAKAQELQPLLTRSALSQRGQIQVDTRTNTLIITDLPERLTTAENLINILDRPEPQVEVEARVVQTTRDFARELGVQWGLNGRVTPEIGNTTGIAFPNRGTISGRGGGVNGNDLTSDTRANPADRTGTVVNLPVAAPTGAIGLAMGAVNGAFNLDVALSALERSGKGRVLSTPRLTTQNNIEAEVAQGIQIPIQTVANNTVTVSFKDAVLLLKVTPQITSANTVIMRITIENASPDFSRQVNNIPPIDTQRAITQVQVNDGATTVIGGIFVSREQSTNERVPLLHRIPLLGWLFRRDINRDESRELLIFITPRILRG